MIQQKQKLYICFAFFSEKDKRREYVCYQKCYEKYYGKPCDKSYKKFWRMMLRKNILYWLLCASIPIIISLLIFGFLTGNMLYFETSGEYRRKRTLTSEEIIAINDELQKQWDEEDRLEALQKEVVKK